jgi:hypothetical protein
VLLIHSAPAGEVSSGRGTHGSQGDAEACYRKVGLRVETLADPAWETLRDYAVKARAADRAPDVVQVTAALDQAGRVPMFTFASGVEVITTTFLDDLVRRLTSGPPPLVVLDVTAPKSRTELVRQLVLRNEFLHTLGGLGSGAPILGFGLHGGRLAKRRYEALGRSLAQWRNGVEAWRDLRRDVLPDGTSESMIAIHATAIWTDVSPDAVLEPNLW